MIPVIGDVRDCCNHVVMSLRSYVCPSMEAKRQCKIQNLDGKLERSERSLPLLLFSMDTLTTTKCHGVFHDKVADGAAVLIGHVRYRATMTPTTSTTSSCSYASCSYASSSSTAA